MPVLTNILKQIDRLSEWSGQIGKWAALLLVLVGTYETVSRQFFNAPTIWAYDTLCMAGGVTYLLGASYAYLHNAHTRVDLIYSHLSPRGQAITDVVCALLFFFPLMGVMFYMAVSWAIRAWMIDEVMFNSFWYPPSGPYRTVFALGLLLLVLQATAKFIRDIHFVLRGERLD
ncbi:TRAP transporter small permease subunit [Xanthobacteraceae bacterium Astr-EGSB]|uniref:TRAP transporter small permease subunit n=1 Tax=Astrobacterium formosum TaxID=3069710 RepID=UPI0027B1C52B|nr:TRAP transporter small permease subunit [Xanthobacteraceae bacterium Astr-EGSB]